MLSQLLGDDRGGGLGIKEAMPDDLANDLLGPPIVGLGAALLALQAESPVPEVLLAKLEVALFAISILRGGLQRAEFAALALDQHREPSGDVVLVGDGQSPARAHEFCRGEIQGEHRVHPPFGVLHRRRG